MTIWKNSWHPRRNFAALSSAATIAKQTTTGSLFFKSFQNTNAWIQAAENSTISAARFPAIPRGKIEFLRQYKFNIAFENRFLPGYTTEKIYEPMMARCMPIYWGNPLIHEEFNPKSFLNRPDFANEDALIEKIIELDKDDAKYLEYLRQPYFYDDTPNIYFSRQRLLDFFEKIFTTKITPVAQTGRKGLSFGRLFGRWKLAKRHHWHPVRPPTWE